MKEISRKNKSFIIQRFFENLANEIILILDDVLQIYVNYEKVYQIEIAGVLIILERDAWR